MANEIRMDSTTDSVDEVRAAAGLPPEVVVPAPVVPPNAETPPVVEVPAPAAGAATTSETPPTSTPDPPAPAVPVADSEAGRALAERKRGMQARINELTREKHDTLRQKEAGDAQIRTLQAELDALKKGATPPAAAVAPPPVEAPETAPAATEPGATPKPKEDDFEHFNDFVTAIAQWSADDAVRRDRAVRQAEDLAKAADQDRRARQTVINERVEKARTSHPDFDDALEKSKSIPTPNYLTAYLQESEHGIEVLYYLATHPDETDRLGKLSPGACLAQVGRLEARFEAGTLFGGAQDDDAPAAEVVAPPAVPVAVSKAPPPGARVKQGAVVPAKNLDDPTLTQREFNAMRDEMRRHR